MTETLFNFIVTLSSAIGKAAIKKGSPVVMAELTNLYDTAIEPWDAKNDTSLSEQEFSVIEKTSINTLKVAWEVLKQEGLLLASDIVELAAIAAGTEIEKELGL